MLILLFLLLTAPQDASRSLNFRAKAKHMDFFGTVVFIGALICLILALQWGGKADSWSSSTVVGLLVSFSLLITLFVYVQYKIGDDALRPLRIMKDRSILSGTLFLFFFGILNYVVGCPNARSL